MHKSLFNKDFKSWHGLCNKVIESNNTISNYFAKAGLRLKDRHMKTRYFENGLAFVGAILILAGVSAAANSALAGDPQPLEIYYSAQK